MKIYTKKGDLGQTTLCAGERGSKASPFLEAIGAIDECNSALGASLATDKTLEKSLTAIQKKLFEVGAIIITPKAKRTFTLKDSDIAELEKWIDAMEEELPPLKNFILPGGHPAAAMLHLARTFCRRAERRTVPLMEKEDVPENVVAYLNRLSDYLFIAARWVNAKNGLNDSVWND